MGAFLSIHAISLRRIGVVVMCAQPEIACVLRHALMSGRKKVIAPRPIIRLPTSFRLVVRESAVFWCYAFGESPPPSHRQEMVPKNAGGGRAER